MVAMDTSSGGDLACYIARGTMAEAQERPSPLRETRFTVGGTEALLCYGAPSVRGREIMGGLLPFGNLERIGANEATALHLSGPANVGNVALEAGSYSLYAMPGETEWTLYLNSNSDRWGIPIDDAVRATELGSVTVAVEPIEEMVETLRYGFEPMDGGAMGDLVLEWEHTRIAIHIHTSG
jgi:hypothetical protein